MQGFVGRVLSVVFLVAASALGQTFMTSGAVGSSGSESHRNVVKDLQGWLWCLSIGDSGADRPLLLQYSTDNGMTWTPSSFVPNDGTSGLSGSNVTNACNLAVDDQGTLHAVWGSYYYPSYYNQYYRNYNPITSTASSIVDLTATTGSSNLVRTAGMDIAIDQANTVWITAHGPSSWVEQLIYSDQPYASTLTFSNAGPISPSASAQSSKIAVDVAGNVHCSYYRNVGNGDYEHRAYYPGSGWGVATTLGNTTPSNDYYGMLAADALGNVHAVFVKDAASQSALWEFRYRKWDATNGWSGEVVLFDATNAQFTGVANYRIFNLACDETTGTAYVVYRDLSQGGSLRLAQIALGAAAFSNLPDLAPPTLGLHEYYLPTLRGSLFPAFNRTGTTLDITTRIGLAPGPYGLFFQRVTVGGVGISLLAPPVLATVIPLLLTSPGEGGLPFACAFSLGTSPGILLSDGRTVPLNPDFLFFFSQDPGQPFFTNTVGTLDAQGQATSIVFLPAVPALIGFTIYGGFLTFDPLAPAGVSTISPALPITFQ